MFNFIKNDEGEDVKAFQWFIDRYDFSSNNPFVTIDMLWSFFYEKGQDKLASGIKEVLSCYTPKLEKELFDDQKRVLKTILLLQAVSDRMIGNRDIFLPNNQNLDLTFEGTDLEFRARGIAKGLLDKHVVTRTPLTGEVFTYCCKNLESSIDNAPFIMDAKAKTTKDMSYMTDSNLRSTVELTGALRLRYSLAYATLSDFDSEAKKAHNPSEENNKIYAISTIARDKTERAALQKKIKAFFGSNPESNIVVIDSSECILGENEYNEFIENYAMALAIGQSDINQRKTYEGYAIEVLQNWAKRIKNGDYYVYSRYGKDGERVANNTDLFIKLMEINKFHYPNCLEGAFTSVLNTMYDSNSLGAGAICGITQETKGTFRSGNEATKLENALKDAWKKPNYWYTSHSYIAQLKTAVEDIIKKEFSKSDRISISAIYKVLKEEPYGFMPCNLTAFILGFILKEYANDIYSYGDNLTTVPLDTNNLAAMISEVIKQENTPDKRYKDKYIITLTDTERAFNRATSDIFGIEEKYCVSITETRSRIREQMKTFSFPIWLIEYTIETVPFKTSRETVCSLINYYCGIANNKNIDGEKSDNDIALSIGQICIDHPEAIVDLKSILRKDNCKQGMLKYLEVYRDGLLHSIANAIGDGGQFINYLAYKFNSDAANWVWNKDTVNTKIDELITEYEIIETSNKVLTKNVTYQETIRAWCDKMSQVRLAYSIIKNELGNSKPFYELLYNLKKTNTLLDSQNKSFLELLKENIENFKHFMASQSDLFMKACGFYLDELTADDVKIILEDDKYGFRGTYIVEPNVYTAKVQEAVKQYKNTLGHIMLRNKWHDLTSTESPMDWSKKYNMPIIIMVPDDEIALARRIFAIINGKSSDETVVAQADDYISKMSYVDELNSETARNKAFTETFLGEYTVLFDDVEKVKQYLQRHVSDAPYYWYESKEVNAKIKAMAKAKYTDFGYGKAKKIIDDMPADQVKAYLKQLIEDNVVVGVEIMKNKG